MESPHHDRKQICVLGRSRKATYEAALSKTCPINHPESPVSFESTERMWERERFAPLPEDRGQKVATKKAWERFRHTHPFRFQVFKHTHAYICTRTALCGPYRLHSLTLQGVFWVLEMFWHALTFLRFSVAYKHIKGTGEITVFSTNRATIICEQHVCTCLYFWENVVYA